MENMYLKKPDTRQRTEEKREQHERERERENEQSKKKQEILSKKGRKEERTRKANTGR